MAAYDGAGLGLATRRYMLPDERGTVASLINSNGTPATINRYDAWGVPGAGNAGRFQYTGQAWIGELGLYHYKARFYSPTLGRFMQTDPIGYDDQINLYAYAANDPINSVDPTGLADVNYTGKHDEYVIQRAGREMDMEGTVTVMAHGPPAHRLAANGYQRIDTRRLAADINRSSRAERIFLAICAMVGTPEGLAQIADLSALTGSRPIMAATSWLYWEHNDNGTKIEAFYPTPGNPSVPDRSRPGSFEVFNGSFADYGVNVPAGFKVTALLVRNGETTAVMRGNVTGSRLQVTKFEKIEMEKQRR